MNSSSVTPIDVYASRSLSLYQIRPATRHTAQLRRIDSVWWRLINVDLWMDGFSFELYEIRLSGLGNQKQLSRI
jgi:hypothetical protein